jgi:hypothetical protein
MSSLCIASTEAVDHDVGQDLNRRIQELGQRGCRGAGPVVSGPGADERTDEVDGFGELRRVTALRPLVQHRSSGGRQPLHARRVEGRATPDPQIHCHHGLLVVLDDQDLRPVRQSGLVVFREGDRLQRRRFRRPFLGQ